MLAAILLIPVFAASANADNAPVTFTGTEVIPVPPASNYAGSAGGDGWAVALSNDAVYNIFHHDSTLHVACHFQSGDNAAQPCWDPNTQGTVTQPNGDGSFGFSASGHPGLYVDPSSGKLYAYTTRSDSTGGVVCFDPSQVAAQGNPFCGFTQLTGLGDADSSGYSNVSNPVQIGSKWYAFNFVDGEGVSAGSDFNKLLCFDLQSLTPCPGQPYALNLGSSPAGAAPSTVSAGLPGPPIAAIGDDVVVPLIFGGQPEVACFDTTTGSGCQGTWPTPVASGYVGQFGAPIPILTRSGTPTGFCFPGGSVPCYSLAGATVSAATPANLAADIAKNGNSVIWNGPAVQIGPRIYIPRWNNVVDCYDYNTGDECKNFPTFRTANSGLYTVNLDPQRPTCIWVNANGGDLQIQNFDAFDPTQGCGEGSTVRVLASSFVVSAPRCTPGSYTSLQVTQPAPGTYKSGTVSFQDPSGNPIPNASDVPLDANGVADLSELNLNTAAGLPQFLIALDTGGAALQQVVVKLTWQGAFDPSCATSISTIVNPPANAGPPPESDVSVSVAGPTYVRQGSNVTFVDTIKNTGKNTATGVELNSPIPAGASFVSATLSNGNACITITSANKLTCFVGTLGSGSSATATIVVAPTGTGSVTQTATVQGDYDTNPANNTATATTSVIAQGAAPPPPPKPAQPGTFNAIATGTVLVNGKPVNADQVFVLNSGDVVDVTNGTITITDFDGGFGTFGNVQPTPRRHVSSANGGTATGTIPAVFQIQQDAQAGAGVTLTLTQGDFSVCSTPRALAAKNQTAVRQLWGSAHGKFTTKARYSSATIRGTIWLTQDRCDGSLTTAVNDVVDVVDFVKNQTITLQPGQSYLAQPKQAAFKPPASKKKPAKKTHGTHGQTAATIRKNGLLWANEIFYTQAQFTAWLKQKGLTWQQFAAKNPKFAEALAGRK